MAGRKKLGKKPLMARVYPDTPDKLKALALKYGYQYGGDGATGAFLDAIASGEIKLATVQRQPKTISQSERIY